MKSITFLRINIVYSQETFPSSLQEIGSQQNDYTEEWSDTI